MSPDVVSTNAGFAILTMVFLFLTAEIFNKTVKENDDDVRAVFGAVTAPFAWVWNTVGRLALPGAAGPFSILALAAFIYGLAEPNFGLNERSLALFFSFLSVFLVITYVYDGGQVLMLRSWGFRSTIRVFPVGVLIAVICVGLTRLEGFQPGLVYGFVAGDALLTPALLTREQEGKKAFYPSVVLLLLAAVAYALADPLRSLAEENDTWVASVPEGIAVGLFVAGLQSVFFQMIPLKFMDGHKLLQWNKLAWLGLATVTAFLFWHVFINEGAAAGEAVSAGDSIAAMVLLGVCFLLTSATYLFFWLKNGRGSLVA